MMQMKFLLTGVVVLVDGMMLAVISPASAQPPETLHCTISTPADDNGKDGLVNVRTRPHGPITSVFVNKNVVTVWEERGNWAFVEGEDDGN
jgi:hypothetical protein